MSVDVTNGKTEFDADTNPKIPVKTSLDAGFNVQHMNVDASALPTGASTEATLSTLNGKVTACNTGAVVLSSGTVTTVSTVTAVTSITNPVTVAEAKASVATRTQVSDTITDGIILAANASRVGATVANDSSATLYLGLGTTAVTSTNYTVKLVQNAYYEVPKGFTGQLRGLWATDPNDGAARVTEF